MKKPNRFSKPHISIDESRGIVTKVLKLPKALPALVKKFDSLNLIAPTIPGIAVPRMISHNLGSSELVLEYIPNLQPVHDLIWKDKYIDDKFERIGRGLALLHEKLFLPKEFIVNLPSPFDQFKDKSRFLFLDCTTMNIQYNSATDEMVFLDWELPKLFGRMGNYGSIYFDIVFFIGHLLSLPPLHISRYNKKVNLINQFLKGYASISDLNKQYLRYVGLVFYTERKKQIKNSKGVKKLRVLRLRNFHRYLKEI